MRQVFSSQRLENVEGVAELLREAGIEVRVTNGRSYKGNRRGTFSYIDDTSPRPAVWVVRSDQQVEARAILREAGLIDSTRQNGSYISSSFRFQSDRGDRRTAAQKRLARIKVSLLGLVVVVAVGGGIYTYNQPAPVPQLASGPFDGSIAATLQPVARAVLASELGNVDTPVACLGVDGGDATPELIAALPQTPLVLVPATQCVELADETRGSYHRASGQDAMIVDVRSFRPSAPDRATVEINAYHHRAWATYKTLEVARVDGAWRVERVIKRVESRGLMGF